MVKAELGSFTANRLDQPTESIQLPFHFSFYSVYKKLQKWQERFPIFKDDLIFKGLTLLYSLTTKKFLDHRSPSHLSRLTLAIHFMQKVLRRAFASAPHLRHLEVKWIPARLSFPFSSKSVLGCLVGFNLTDRYELFDEENVMLLLKKNHPEFKFVKDSTYCNISPNHNLKIIYFEIEKKDDSFFSITERISLKANLENQIGGSVQKLAPMVFMRRNEEEVYKMILTLVREIQSPEDIPQAWITFEHQSTGEIIFLVVLVYASPETRLPLHKCLALSPDCKFVSERHTTVRHSQDHPIEAHVFRLHLVRSLSFIRSDGSLDFYASRQKVVSLLSAALGEFRDYNGGSLIKQRELLDDFKTRFPAVAKTESELMDTFFYALTPLEKQAILNCDTLEELFQHFLDIRRKKLPVEVPYTLDVRRTRHEAFVAVHARNTSWKETILRTLEHPVFKIRELAYTVMDIPEGLFFHATLPHGAESCSLTKALHEALDLQHQTMKKRKILRIGLEYSLSSLDPRVGGDSQSSNVLRLLFEGLTRIDKNGNVELGIAESVEVSPNLKHYTFKLRPTLWNDGTSVTAYDFEYAWKKILSPDFQTAFSYLFHPIKYAKEAKEGRVHLDKTGINVLDERTLKIELAHPTPYFLELTAQPLYYPVRRFIDQKHPQWPYQVGNNYPCNGPFQMAMNDPSNQTYQLIKNPFYLDSSTIEVDEVLATQINPHQAFQAFQQGELDWIGNPLGAWHPFYAPRPEDQKISIPNSSAFWLVFNTRCPPFHHDKVRQAFAFAIDRTMLIADTFLPLTPAYSPLLPRHQIDPSTLFPKHDVQKAQRLLHEGLNELGLSKEDILPLPITFCQGGIREEIAVRLKQQFWELLGIECQLQPLQWSSFFSKMTTGDFQVGLMYWTSRTNDPVTTLNVFRYSKEEINFSNWEDAIFQHWLSLSDQEVNALQRGSHLMHAEEKLCQEMPIIPLFYQPYQALIKEGIKVIYHNSFDLAKSSHHKATD